MTLNEIQVSLFTLIPEAYDQITSDFDFVKNSYAIEMKIGDSVQDNIINDEITLQIRITGIKENKMLIQNKAFELDKKINDIDFKDCWIVRDNAYYTSYYDTDKFNSVLQYTIKNY
ncbi:hypothetical protein NNC19_07195 [Clostridium sp. SHJSY1]|uniref:hypothetical protein n=1 Tax=Clostridium sp. SHJSY1 TaxID=2942483 RepID=UPI0028762BF0|nr:hypothetical protein [Clostridium sp. SHJSY1]MDS0525459.1 hypothetical protein [Clostridium sp. SHJSY1]